MKLPDYIQQLLNVQVLEPCTVALPQQTLLQWHVNVSEDSGYLIRLQARPIGLPTTTVIGKLTARVLLEGQSLRDYCEADYKALQSRFPQIDDVFIILYSEILPEHQQKYKGTGCGLALYDYITRLAGVRNYAIATNSCVYSGSTSDDAKRVWESLKRRYAHEGNIVFAGGTT